jgi:hypothetical protein
MILHASISESYGLSRSRIFVVFVYFRAAFLPFILYPCYPRLPIYRSGNDFHNGWGKSLPSVTESVGCGLIVATNLKLAFSVVVFRPGLNCRCSSHLEPLARSATQVRFFSSAALSARPIPPKLPKRYLKPTVAHITFFSASSSGLGSGIARIELAAAD